MSRESIENQKSKIVELEDGCYKQIIYDLIGDIDESEYHIYYNSKGKGYRKDDLPNREFYLVNHGGFN